MGFAECTSGTPLPSSASTGLPWWPLHPRGRGPALALLVPGGGGVGRHPGSPNFPLDHGVGMMLLEQVRRQGQEKEILI